MKVRIQTVLTPADRLLSAMASLADVTRLRLLRLLERQELSVIELCDVLQRPQPTISRHLKVLVDQRWIFSRRERTVRIYRMVLDELEPSARKLWLVAREQTDTWAATKQDRLRVERVLQARKIDGSAFFAGAAGEWDRLRRDLYGERFSIAAMLATLPRDTVVADLGCGSGHLAVEMAPFVKAVIGIDASSAMLKAANRRAAGIANIQFLKGDLSNAPIESGSCDAALMVLALTYVEHPDDAIAELARVLKPGGRAVIVDLLQHDRDDFRRKTGQAVMGFDLSTIERCMTLAGLSDIACRPLSAEQNVKGPGLFLAFGQKFLPPIGHR